MFTLPSSSQRSSLEPVITGRGALPHVAGGRRPHRQFRLWTIRPWRGWGPPRVLGGVRRWVVVYANGFPVPVQGRRAAADGGGRTPAKRTVEHCESETRPWAKIEMRGAKLHRHFFVARLYTRLLYLLFVFKLQLNNTYGRIIWLLNGNGIRTDNGRWVVLVIYPYN